MAKHYKTDLLTDEALATFSTKAGDVLTLDVPKGDGSFTKGEHTVLTVETTDAGVYEGVHYTRVALELEAE